MRLEHRPDDGGEVLERCDCRVVRDREAAADVEGVEPHAERRLEVAHERERLGDRGGESSRIVELAADVEAESGDPDAALQRPLDEVRGLERAHAELRRTGRSWRAGCDTRGG